MAEKYENEADEEASMVSMKRTAKENKAMQETMTSPAKDGADYPYGLCLTLGASELKKLKVKDLPEVGQVFCIDAYAKVTRVSSSASEGGPSNASVELQITEMALEDEGMPTNKPKSTVL